MGGKIIGTIVVAGLLFTGLIAFFDGKEDDR